MIETIQADILTGVILTWNEEENIGRVLQQLDRLGKIIIIDSGSTDETHNNNKILFKYRNILQEV